MKILYIGRERRDAQSVATALRGIAQNVTLLWAQSLEQAGNWLEENRDLAALVVDAPGDTGSWPASLKHLRTLPVRPAVVVVVPEGTSPAFESFGSPADGYVTKSETFLRDLPIAVRGAVTRVRGSQAALPVAGDAVEHQQRLEATAEPSPRGGWKAFEKVFPAKGGKSALQQRLAALEASVRENEQLWSTERAEATAREEYLEALVHLERMARTDLEQKLADATAALQDAQQLHLAALSAARAAHELAAAEQLTEQQHQFEAQIAQEVDTRTTERRASFERELAETAADRDQLGARVNEIELALEEAQRQFHLAVAEIERLRQREVDLSAQLADSHTVRDDLDRQLVEIASTVEQSHGREAELIGQVQREAAMRAAVEQALIDADADLRDTRQRHHAALAAAAAELTNSRARFDRELSQIAADREILRQQLDEVEGALEQARHDRQAVAADVDGLKQRETELFAQLAEVVSSRNNLERQLTAAQAAFEEADARNRRERLAESKRAAEREAQLEEQIRDEQDTRVAVEQAAAEAAVEAEAALQDARHKAAAELAEREAYFSRELSQTTADRAALTQRVIEAEIELDQARRDYDSAAANIERVMQRESDLAAQLADADAARHTLEGKLARALQDVTDLTESAARDRAAAANREADLETKLVNAIHAHTTLEQTLTETRSAALDVERWFREEADALRAQSLEREAHFAAQLATQSREYEARLGEATSECARLVHALAEEDADVQRLTADLSDARQVIDDTRRQSQEALNQLSSEHAHEIAALTATAAEREEKIEAMERARAELQQRLQAALAVGRDEIEHVQERLIAAVQELEATKRRHDVLQSEPDGARQHEEQRREGRSEGGTAGEQNDVFQAARDGAFVSAG